MWPSVTSSEIVRPCDSRLQRHLTSPSFSMPVELPPSSRLSRNCMSTICVPCCAALWCRCSTGQRNLDYHCGHLLEKLTKKTHTRTIMVHNNFHSANNAILPNFIDLLKSKCLHTSNNHRLVFQLCKHTGIDLLPEAINGWQTIQSLNLTEGSFYHHLQVHKPLGTKHFTKSITLYCIMS